MTLSAEGGLTFISTWVESSYAVNPDRKSHTGGCATLERGMLYWRSTKHEINAKSSTEAELVGESDYLPFMIWTQYVLEAQGYKVDRNDLNQDNMSTIKFEKNVKRSSA